MDALSHIANANGDLSRFPALQKLIGGDGKHDAGTFNKEESEAETLLDELNWGSSLEEDIDLHQTLSNQADALNHEIIDFLLQWEEMDEATDTEPAHSIASNGPIQGHIKRINVHDTSEVLTSLAQVDVELEAADRWLGEQIGRLSEIQANLHLIEDESGALETSWHSLRSVQEIVTLLVSRYSLQQRHDEVLQSPDRVMGPIMTNDSDLNTVEQQLLPLIQAITVVRDALSVKHGDVPGITPAKWKQLLKMTSVASQRAKLSDLTESFIANFSATSVRIFTWLLTHKSLTQSSVHSSKAFGIVVKQFSLSKIANCCLLSLPQGQRLTNTDYRAPEWYGNCTSTDYNQFLFVQQNFQNRLLLFLPLLRLFVELANSYAQTLRDAYVQAVSDYLYAPILKTLGKDLSHVTTHKNSIVCFANCSKQRVREGHPLVLPLAYWPGGTSSAGSGNEDTGTASSISPWVVLKVALMIISPVLEREEEFIKTKMSLAQPSANVAHPERANALSNATAYALMKSIFDQAFTNLQAVLGVHSSVIAGSGECDGVEAVAMLSALTEFEDAYFEAITSAHDAAWAEVLLSMAQKEQHKNKTTKLSSGSHNAEIKSRGIAEITTFGLSNSSQKRRQNTGNVAISTSSSAATVGESTVTTAAADISTTDKPEAPALALNYVAGMLESMRESLLSRIAAYAADQEIWLNGQKADSKSPVVFGPFVAFPILAAQVVEMTNGYQFECVDNLLHKLAKALFNWLAAAASHSEKYADKMKITNYSYFIQSMDPLRIAILDNFMIHATQQREEALVRYVNWMVSYEFPALSALAVRMDGIGTRVKEDELSLYVRRKDVLAVVKEIDLNTLDHCVYTMYKRLEKHFRSDFDTELRLVESTWFQIMSRVVGILSRLENAALLSYQITLAVGPQTVEDMFKRYANTSTSKSETNRHGVVRDNVAADGSAIAGDSAVSI